MIKRRVMKWGTILASLSKPSAIGVLTWGSKRLREGDMTPETDVKVMQSLDGGHKPRSACNLQEVQKNQGTDSPWKHPEGRQSCQHIAPGTVRPISGV